MRFRESVPRASSSCGISFRRDRPHPRARLADAARPRRLCRDRARQCRAGARHCRRRRRRSQPASPPWRPRCAFPPVRSRSSSSAGGGGACDSTRSIAACSRPRSVARPAVDGRRHRSGAKDTSSRFAFPPRCVGSIRARFASESCSSFPSAAHRRRAPSSPCVSRSDAPRGAEDGFDERGWLARRGVHVVLHGGDWRIVGRRGGIGGVSDRLRAHVARAIAPGLGGERRAVLAGIVLGEDEGLTDELRDNFKASGLYHLLAVSGQNVAFLALGVLGLAWLLGIHRLAAEVAAIGGDRRLRPRGRLATVGRPRRRRGRAGLARVAARPPARSLALPALGAAVLLAWTPACLFEPGFQLSFAAVGAIFLLLPRLRLALEGYPMPDWLRDALAVSTACGAATAPILWLQFGSVPVYSLLANALVALAIGPLLGLALVGSLRRAVAAVGRARARLGERLARRVHRRLRASSSPGCRSPRSARGKAVCVLLGITARPARAPAAAAVAAAGGAGVRCDRRSRPPRLAAASVGVAAAAERAPHHVPRRRPGRLDSPAGA